MVVVRTISKTKKQAQALSLRRRDDSLILARCCQQPDDSETNREID